MAQLALGVAGAAAGFALGGPLGASIGWSLGSAAGSLLFPEKVQGPRLSDLRVHVSTYGQMTPRLWGTMRFAGNWIDGKEKFDEHEEKSGGKGGPEVTNYTYTYSGAVRLCERVGGRDSAIIGIRRVWANGRTVDMTKLPMTIYLGTEEQLPDPTLESIHDVGNVPAYRSIAYVVFTDLPLADYGNALPNLEFECFTSADKIPIRFSIFDPIGAAYGQVVSGVTLEDGVISVASYRPDNKTYHVRHFLMDGTPTGTDFDDVIPNCYALSAVIQNKDLAIGQRMDDHATYCWYVGNVQGEDIGGGHAPPSLSNGLYQNDQVYVQWYVGSDSGIMSFSAPNGNPVGSPNQIIGIAGNAGDFTISGSTIGRIYVFDTGSGTLYEYDEADLTLLHTWVVATDFPATPSLTYRGGGFFRYGNVFATNLASSTVFRMNVLSVDGSSNITSYPQDRDGSELPTFDWTGGQIVYLGDGYVLGRDGIVLLEAPLTGVLLSEIVGDISNDCGLADDEIDVSDLTDTVDGYLASQQSSARDWIQPLRDAWPFDAFEDEKVVFVRRGKPAIVTIPDDELAAHIHGEDSPPILGTVRSDELSLPATVNVSAVDAAADYQTNTQYARWQTTYSISDVTLNLPISLSGSKIKSVAEVQLAEARGERNRFTFFTSLKYLKYTPTDVINAHGIDIRIVEKRETHPGVIQWDGVFSRPQAFAQPGVAVTRLGFTSSPPTVVTVSDTVQTYLLDIPLVNDTNEQTGFYAAMGTRATLFKSTDGGATYASVATATVPDTIGETADILGSFYGGNTFDEANVVTVVTTGGELESATEVAVLNGANEAVVGDEVIQFKNAELVNTNTYELTGLLRGRLGTEWAMNGHSVGERFAMLPALRVASSMSELNIPRTYKPVPFGGTVAAATAQGFTNTGQSLKPYSPVLLGGGVDGSGNVGLNWTRRTRVGGAWVPFYDVPLSESAEAYKVQIWNNDYTRVARIIDSTTPSVTYTSAQQVTDFGAAQATIFFSVAQVGAVLGQQARGSAVGSGASNGNPISAIPPYQSPTSGSPTPPPAFDALNLALTWSNPGNQRKYSNSAGGFACDKIVVASFTTPAGTSANVGRIFAGEWASGTGPVGRVACLSTIAGDFTGGALGPNSRIVSTSPTVQFTVGANTRPYPTPALAPSTTYYFNIKNDNGFGACTCFVSDCDIFVELAKPTGL